jgi:hypothetical protein
MEGAEELTTCSTARRSVRTDVKAKSDRNLPLKSVLSPYSPDRVKKRPCLLSTRGTTGAREISGELRGEMITGFPQ